MAKLVTVKKKRLSKRGLFLIISILIIIISIIFLLLNRG